MTGSRDHPSHDHATSPDYTTSQDHATPQDHATSPEPPPSRRFTIIFAALMVMIAAGWIWVWQTWTGRLEVAPPPTIAVTLVAVEPDTVPAGPEVAAVGDSVYRLITAAIRQTGLPVAETRYMRRTGDTTGIDALIAVATAAAREAGADQIVHAELRRGTDLRYELDVRRRDATTDELLGMLRTRGSTLTDVVERMRAQLALSMGLRVPQGPLLQP